MALANHSKTHKRIKQILKQIDITSLCTLKILAFKVLVTVDLKNIHNLKVEIHVLISRDF